MKLGGFIRKERLKKDITLRGLAKLSGVSLTYLSMLENEKVEKPNMEMVLDVFKTLEIQTEKLRLFGLMESDPMDLEAIYNNAKEKRLLKEIHTIIDGMELDELESLHFLLHEYHDIINLIDITQGTEKTKLVLDQFTAFLEFMDFYEAKKQGLPVHLNPVYKKEQETFKKVNE